MAVEGDVRREEGGIVRPVGIVSLIVDTAVVAAVPVFVTVIV